MSSRSQAHLCFFANISSCGFCPWDDEMGAVLGTNLVFHVFYDVFEILKAGCPGIDCFSQASQSYIRQRTWHRAHLSYVNQAIRDLQSQFSSFTPQASISPALSHTGPGTRQPEIIPLIQTPTTLFQLASPQPSALPCKAIPTDLPNKGFDLAFLSERLSF